MAVLSSSKTNAQYFEHMYWDAQTSHNEFYDGVYNRLNPAGYAGVGTGGVIGPAATAFVVTLPNSTPVVNVNLNIKENVNSYPYHNKGYGMAEYNGGYLLTGEIAEPGFNPGIIPGIKVNNSNYNHTQKIVVVNE